MKKHIFNLLVSAIFCMGLLNACNKDAEGEIYTGTGASFASTAMSVEVTAEDNGVVQVPVYRSTTEGEATVQLAIDDAAVEEGILNLTNPNVTFAAGEGIAYAELSFGSLDRLSGANRYQATLTIADASQVSVSGEATITVTVQRQLTWVNIGTGVYTSGLFTSEDGSPASWEQPVEKALEGNVYRLPDCIVEGYPMVFTLSDDGQSLLSWDIQATGYENETYGMVYFAAAGMTREGNVLSFPMQGVVEYNGGWGLLYDGFTETLELPAE